MAQQTAKKIALKPLGNRVLAAAFRARRDAERGNHPPRLSEEETRNRESRSGRHGKRLDDGKILPIPVKVGDTILMDKYSGQEVDDR